MNVYAIKASGHYAGGMAIVAANTRELAIATAATIPRNGYEMQWAFPDAVIFVDGVYFEGGPRVIEFYEMGE